MCKINRSINRRLIASTPPRWRFLRRSQQIDHGLMQKKRPIYYNLYRLEALIGMYEHLSSLILVNNRIPFSLICKKID